MHVNSKITLYNNFCWRQVTKHLYERKERNLYKSDFHKWFRLIRRNGMVLDVFSRGLSLKWVSGLYVLQPSKLKFLSFGSNSSLDVLKLLHTKKVNVGEARITSFIANWNRKEGDFLCWFFGLDPKKLSTSTAEWWWWPRLFSDPESLIILLCNSTSIPAQDRDLQRSVFTTLHWYKQNV